MTDVEKLLRRIDKACIASCSCGTKTPEIQFHDEHCLYRVLSEAADALAALQAENERLRAEADAMKKAAQDYCWMRYKDREPLHLNSPAVFTSHEWQKIGEAMDRARAALKGDAP